MALVFGGLAEVGLIGRREEAGWTRRRGARSMSSRRARETMNLFRTERRLWNWDGFDAGTEEGTLLAADEAVTSTRSRARG